MRDEWREEGLGPTPPTPERWDSPICHEMGHMMGMEHQFPGFYPDPQPARGMSACSYILGALALIMGFYPPFFPIVWSFSLGGLAAGIYARYRRRRAKVPYNTAKWGIILSLVGLLLGCVGVVVSS